jgi:hypothetical protein
MKNILILILLLKNQNKIIKYSQILIFNMNQCIENYQAVLNDIIFNTLFFQINSYDSIFLSNLKIY